MILYRPVKGERFKDWRLTQAYGNNFVVGKKWENGELVDKRFYGDVVKARDKHEGLDYAGPKPGDKIPVYSCHEGVIVKSGFSTGRGNHVTIKDNFGLIETIYAHLNHISPEIKSGKKVKAMQEIGIMGNTGTSTGVHVHLGLRNISGEWLDPTPHITDRSETVEKDPLLQEAIDKGYYNGEPGSGLTDRIVISYMKAIKGEQKNEFGDIEYQCNHDIETADISGEEHFIHPVDGVITYKVNNEHPGISDIKEEILFNNVFTHIEGRVNPIKFKRVRGDEPSQINIWFAKNGDPLLPKPFKTQSIAYAYYPRTERKGEIYINIESKFDISGNNPQGEEAIKVLTHEFLHSIRGVKHSEDKASIMYYKNLKEVQPHLPLVEKMNLRRRAGV